MVCGPALGMLKLIRSMMGVLALPLAATMAALSEPAPASFVLITVKVAAWALAVASTINQTAIRTLFRIHMATPCDFVSWFVGASATRRSWVLRGVVHGFSVEARTRGFPSPSFGGFSIVVVCVSFIRRVAGQVLIVNITGLFQAPR